MTSAATQSLGSGMPTAVCWPCICCRARTSCSSVQQSCRNTAARLRSRGLSEREKRSMHCTMAASVTSGRDEGVKRFVSVVMADRTVSSLRLDRQLVTRLIPLLCRMMSRHSGSMLRLHSPPKDEKWLLEIILKRRLRAHDWDFYITHPFRTPQSFRSPQWACPWRGRSPEAPSGSPRFLGRRRSWPGWPEPAPSSLQKRHVPLHRFKSDTNETIPLKLCL